MVSEELSFFTTFGKEKGLKFFKPPLRPDSEFVICYSPDIKNRLPAFITLSGPMLTLI